MHILHYPLLLLLRLLLHVHGCRADKIINGSTVADKAMQYMASLQNNGKHVCGGFVIAPNFVLTAAHCNKGLQDEISVVLGTHNIRKANARYNIGNKDKFIHEEFKNVTSGNDIMLLKLSRRIGRGVKTVQIPSSDKLKLKNSTKCLVAGWGKTRKNNSSYQLQAAQVQVINLQDCQVAWNHKLPQKVMCAKGFKRTGPSLGDSGGPLVCNGLAVGIVSFKLDENCPQILPAVYTKISKFLPWIKRKVGPSFAMQNPFFE